MTDPFSEDDAKPSGPNAIGVEQLRQFVERYERLEEDKKAVLDDQKEVKAEAKANGYDMKAFMEIIKLRKLDREDLQEREALRQLYGDALGVFG